jgi:hypothetical protein
MIVFRCTLREPQGAKNVHLERNFVLFAHAPAEAAAQADWRVAATTA